MHHHDCWSGGLLPDPRLLLPLPEAGARLELSRATVQRLVTDGTLPSVKIGRSRRIAVVDLEAFVSALREDGAQ
jgi:excisionase family DNA binding protein